MPSVKARAEVIAEFCAELCRYSLIFDEIGVLAVRVIGGERGGGNVFGYPLGVARSAIESGSCRQGGMEIGDGAREAVSEETVGVHGRNDVLEAC